MPSLEALQTPLLSHLPPDCLLVLSVGLHCGPVYDQAGFSDKFLGTCVCYAFNLCGCLLAVMHIDRSGRRRLMLLGAGGMLVSHLGASLADLLSPEGGSVAGTYFILLFLSSYFLCYARWVHQPGGIFGDQSTQLPACLVCLPKGREVDLTHPYLP